jgi:hypothetical protein
MSSRPLSAFLPSPGMPIRSGDPFAHDLAELIEDIQRTREWFNRQLDSQLACLHKLCAAIRIEEPKRTLSTAMLFEAPRPLTPVPAVPPVAPAAAKAISSVHQAIILPPTLTATLDPQLEQATLHELNNALTRAFSEISARGGMIS